jgi:hypothetical protein
MCIYVYICGFIYIHVRIFYVTDACPSVATAVLDADQNSAVAGEEYLLPGAKIERTFFFDSVSAVATDAVVRVNYTDIPVEDASDLYAQAGSGGAGT